MEIEHSMRQLWSMPESEQRALTEDIDVGALDIAEGDALLDGLQQAQRDQAQAAAYRFAQVDRFRQHREASFAARRDLDGMFARAMRAELAAALCLPERTVEALLGRARILVEDLPTTLSLLRAGHFTERHAVIMADEAAGLSVDERVVFEREVLPWAERLRAGLFERKAQQIGEFIQGADNTERHESARTRRDITAQPGRNGMGWLSGYLPNPEIIAIDNLLTTIARSLQVQGEQGRGELARSAQAGGERAGGEQGRGELRTLPQLRADVFVDILLDEGRLLPPGQSETELRAPVAHRGFRAEVSVVVPALTLMGKSSLPGILEGACPLDAETARAIAGTATGFTRILTHPETGAVLSFGKDRYKVPSELKRYLRYRDETCRFVGCGKRARFCDIDHTVPWLGSRAGPDSGQTAHDNLAHLCRGHHKTKDAGWSVAHARDGTGALNWVSPLGRTYSTYPTTPPGGTARTRTAWLDDPPPF